MKYAVKPHRVACKKNGKDSNLFENIVSFSTDTINYKKYKIIILHET